jgi:hypothetical protein
VPPGSRIDRRRSRSRRAAARRESEMGMRGGCFSFFFSASRSASGGLLDRAFF